MLKTGEMAIGKMAGVVPEDQSADENSNFGVTCNNLLCGLGVDGGRD